MVEGGSLIQVIQNPVVQEVEPPAVHRSHVIISEAAALIVAISALPMIAAISVTWVV